MTDQIDIISDIHLEFLDKLDFNDLIKKIKKIKKSSTIALLGDIGKPYEDSYKQFLYNILCLYKNVLLIAGNHEFYNDHYSVDHIHSKINDICQSLNEQNEQGHVIYYLNRNIVEIDDYVYIGCTLWSHIKNISATGRWMNDYKLIKQEIKDKQGNLKKISIKPQNTNEWHQIDVNYLIEQMEYFSKSGKKMVILTHHAPITDKMIHPPEYRGSLYSEAFCTDLSKLFEYKPIAWFYGHTHQSYKSIQNQTQIVSNPMCYNLEALDTIDQYFTINYKPLSV